MSLMKKNWQTERILRKFARRPVDVLLKQGVPRRLRMMDFIQLLNAAELSKNEISFFLCVVLCVRVLVSECVSINYHFVLV